MILFHLLYYICIFTIVTFYECNYVNFQFKCFIMKLAFYHLASYGDELWTAAEEITVDIMDVQINDWVAATYENNWFPGIVFNVQSINSSHSILSITLLTNLMRIDPTLKLARKGEWNIWDGGEGDWIEVRGGLSYIFISVAVKSRNISPYIWLEQEAVAFSPYTFTYVPILYVFHGP